MKKPKEVTWVLRLLLLLPLVASGWSLRVSGMRVPSVVVSGSTVHLMCSYEMRKDRPDPLYSIKWYRGVEQFYEYVPKKEPPVRVYPLPYLHVDRSHSDGSTVVLKGVTKESSGTFRCEVVGDKPHFETDDHAENMTVLEIPLWGPEIHGVSDSNRVRPGDIVRARCLVGPSYPHASVTWFLNYQSLPNYAQVTSRMLRDDIGRNIQTSELEFEVSETSFRRGAITLTCDAQLSSLYHKTENVTLVHADQPQPAGFGWFSSGSSMRSYLMVVGVTMSFLLVQWVLITIL